MKITRSEFNNLVDFAVNGSDLPDSTLHGELHWRAVATQGLKLVQICDLKQRGRTAAALFGLFHDCRRENDEYDEDHGLRGSQALISAVSQIGLDNTLLSTLAQSMIQHDGGTITPDPIKGIGWDADRSTLTRVGIVPSYRYFSVLPAEAFEDFVESGYTATHSPMSWDEIYQAAFVA